MLFIEVVDDSNVDIKIINTGSEVKVVLRLEVSFWMEFLQHQPEMDASTEKQWHLKRHT
ncbi:MAG: hypothetical protein ACJA2S_001516 [Cyclobacteriaceae bacterium]|jgi:hypothetical protein